MKRPFEVITEHSLKNLERVRENQLYNFSNSEKFMVWIVGFSIGGISIIFTNLTSLNELYIHSIIKLVLCCLCLSIITGLIYRYSFYKFQYYYQSIEFYLQGAFSKTQMMEVDPKDLSNINDIHEIVRLLKDDYDLDYFYVLETYNNYDESNKEIIRNNLKNNYKKTGESIKREYEFTQNYVKEVHMKGFGVSKKKIDKLLNRNPSKYFKIYGAITTITFILSCLSFMFVIILLAILY